MQYTLFFITGKLNVNPDSDKAPPIAMNSISSLYIVSTPIGNLADITLRAIEVLKTVDFIAAEDTRHTARLLQHHNVNTRMISYHDHSKQDRVEEILDHLREGKNIALVTDAGTPLISDPGYKLVVCARNAGITVTPIPGASALMAAVSVAGLPTDRFVFEGFLPAKQLARKKRLEEISQEIRTLVFYESPHRVLACLQDMSSVLGSDREVVVARELTKTFETVYKNTLSELLLWMENDPNQQRGEFVLVVNGNKEKPGAEIGLDEDHILDILLQELSVKQASSLTAKLTGGNKKTLYRVAVKKKQSS